ncbi:MAG: sodium:calcium antiporter, partial [Gemmatimonadetes bacterium]|nr:sodium:calcium antiporter [Gemmatimonadota bacterium]
SLGNIIGSDIFNLLGVLGLAGILRGMQVDGAARASLGALSLMVVIVVIFMRSDWKLSRQEGFLLVTLALLRWGLDFGT